MATAKKTSKVVTIVELSLTEEEAQFLTDVYGWLAEGSGRNIEIFHNIYNALCNADFKCSATRPAGFPGNSIDFK